MTDHHAGYVVILDRNIREDDAADTLNALRMVRGVQSVEPIVAGIETQIAESRARSRILGRLYDVLGELAKP